MMKKIFQTLSLFMVIAVLISCEETDIATTNCDTHAIVEDWTGLDGCGFLLKLDNGDYLEPILVGYCGTPPISEEQLNDPMTNFTLEDDQSVMINYNVAEDYGSICMKGTPVKITCIEEAGNTTGEEGGDNL